MITKIKVDGKEHVAIVFEGSADIDEAMRVKLALYDLLGGMLAYDDMNMISNDTYADLNQLLRAMQTPVDLESSFFQTWYGKDTLRKASVKPCEIYV